MLKLDRLMRRIQELGEYGHIPGTERGVNAMEFSDANIQARIKLLQYMEESRLEIQIDQIGNIIAILPSKNGVVDKDIVLMGSHIDTVKTGGRYDGRLGVLGGLEVIQGMKEQAQRGDFPLAVIAYTGEEGARFQPAMIGSRVERGLMTLEEALAIRSHDEEDKAQPFTMADGMEKFRVALVAASSPEGYRGMKLKQDYSHFVPPGLKLRSYLELHIEQGTELEEAGLPVSAVNAGGGISQRFVRIELAKGADATKLALKLDGQIRDLIDEGSLKDYKDGRATVGIIAPEFSSNKMRREVYRFDITGESAHAGGAPMRKRRDAGVAAARILDYFERHVGGGWVATFEEEKPGINTVPSQISFSIALPAHGRNVSPEEIEKLVERLQADPVGKREDGARVPSHEGVRIRCRKEVMEVYERPADKLTMSIDVRHVDDQKIAAFDASVNKLLQAAKNDYPNSKITYEVKQRIAPAPFHRQMREKVQALAKSYTGANTEFPLFPGHDAHNHVFAADGVRVPSEMIIIPSIGGISHNPVEFSREKHIGIGLKVLQDMAAWLLDRNTVLERAQPQAKIYPVGEVHTLHATRASQRAGGHAGTRQF